MQTMVPLYGFGGTGITLNAMTPAGAAETVAKGGKRMTVVANSSGAAVFKGKSSGQWTRTSTSVE